MRYVLAWSRGKDSTASAILAHELNLPLDGIVTVKPDPFKLERGFIQRFEEYMGMGVEILPGPTFEDFFFLKKTKKSAHPGTIYGWPMTVFGACTRILKTDVMRGWREQQSRDICMIVGIAADEHNRLPSLGEDGGGTTYSPAYCQSAARICAPIEP